MTSKYAILIRSLLFNLLFFSWSMFAACLFAPLFIKSTRAAQWTGSPWGNGVMLLARLICGIRYEIRGTEYLIDGPVLYASKHQSAWDTVIFLVLFKRPAYILKRELLRIPLWGWYLWRMKMVSIDRLAGASSLKNMIRQSKEAIAEQRPLIIFPEGTRMRPGATPHYHSGIAALYSQLKVPVVPVALNSGVYWGKNAFTKYPGKIIMQCLPPIPPGLSKEEFMKALQQSVEPASQALLEEAQAHKH